MKSPTTSGKLGAGRGCGAPARRRATLPQRHDQNGNCGRCGTSQIRGRFPVITKFSHGRTSNEMRGSIPSSSNRMRKAITEWCREHRHESVGKQQEALNRKLRGHYQYYGRSTNFRSIAEFSERVRRIWQKWLNRRSRGNPLNWAAYAKLLQRYPLLKPLVASLETHARAGEFGLRNRVHHRDKEGDLRRRERH